MVAAAAFLVGIAVDSAALRLAPSGTGLCLAIWVGRTGARVYRAVDQDSCSPPRDVLLEAAPPLPGRPSAFLNAHMAYTGASCAKLARYFMRGVPSR